MDASVLSVSCDGRGTSTQQLNALFKELKTYQQIDLTPGESARVRLELLVAEFTVGA